ncbi:MAG TPA: RnfABCDGE type electron transport complex subunit D [Firmicutes bacterium]|nr:RnfABCDGE type electron transport complex subunit D [Bacillota bacterium]
MTYKTAPAPHLRKTEPASFMCLDVLIALLPLLLFSAVRYGMRPAVLVLAGMLTAAACETACCLMMKRVPTVTDGSALVTGGIVGMLVPPMAPYWLPVVGAAFAILVVKMPMGGSGRNLFNPAAAGAAVLTLCFSGTMFRYPDPGQNIPLPLTGSLAQVITESSPTAQMMSGGETLYSPIMLFLGDFPGPVGATAIAVLAACALYLFTRRSASPLITLSYLAACAGMATLFPRVTGTGNSVLLELCSGYLLFAGVFLLNDPVTAPRHWLGRLFYGLLAGVLVMLLRYYGRFEEGACFAVLLMNAFSPVIDRMSWYLLHFHRIRKGARSG